MSFSRPIQWYHSHADPIWPDDTFNVWVAEGAWACASTSATLPSLRRRAVSPGFSTTTGAASFSGSHPRRSSVFAQVSSSI